MVTSKRGLALPTGFQLTDAFLKFLRDKAESKRQNAGYGGAMDDGGARALEEQVSCFVAGRDGMIPSQWVEYANEYAKITDPEYVEYQRLQRKFGDRR